MRQEAFSIELGEGLTLRGNVHTDEAAGAGQPLLLFCHGFKGFKDWGSFPYVADELAKRGVTTIRFNFSCNGVGESLTEFDELEKFGRNTYARELADLQALVEWIDSGEFVWPDYVDKSRLYVLGHSKGGGDAILFGAGNPRVAGIVTWNGIADVNLFDAGLRKQIAETGVGYIANARTGQDMPITRTVIEDVDQNREAYDILAKVSSMETPLCILSGEKDFVRLVEGAKRIHQAAKHSELHWIEGGDHTWNTRHPFAGTSPQLEAVIEQTAAFVRTPRT
ncbi:MULTISPECIES: alpha/beta hydrolase [Brevibacillus]|uniref:alpha/beta hydrolase n=1 Tax=Brevibacillus TaxID=55080 RepID=UPI000EC5B4E7|nr:MULTISPECIES: alpha/beta hydrolase [Brevibacillus]MDR4998619.1 alpha/beta hydrolase [Brevibacillus parabrevis]HBZ80836.1 alpha/beta hydrolase [Brevibacillus sp.]